MNLHYLKFSSIVSWCPHISNFNSVLTIFKHHLLKITAQKHFTIIRKHLNKSKNNISTQIYHHTLIFSQQSSKIR